MKRLFKWVGWSAVFGAVLLTIFVAAMTALAVRTIQPPTGKQEIAGLQQPVSVTRDAHGIPHIVAKSYADAAMALGFTHAQDRLWQMDFLRMTGQGRLSEILGVNKDVQEIDIFLRTLGFTDQVKSSLEVLDANSRSVLEAYAAGVNVFLDRKQRMLEPGLPPEFLILRHRPERWKPEHSLLVLKIMSLQLSMNMGREIDRLSLAARGLSSAEIDDVMPYHRDESPAPMPDMRRFFKLVSPEEIAEDKGTSVYADLRRNWVDDVGKWASNNWVLSGAKTKSGKPLLANDPHLTFSAPSLWYLAHLSWPDGRGGTNNVIGGTIPAIPAVVLGRNDKIAWGFTNAGADVQDLYVEQLKPDDPSVYFTQKGWAKFDIKREVIKVKGSVDLTFDRRVSRHGPLLPRSFKKYGKFLRSDSALALKWTGLSDKDQSFQQILQIGMADSVQAFGKVVDPTISPMQAMVVADAAGAIGLFAKAEVPIRLRTATMKGRAPVPGWTEDDEWVGKVETSKLPAVVNPLKEAIGTANSRFVTNNVDPFLTYDWDEPFRHDRLQQTMIDGNQKLGLVDMIRGQTDTYSPALSDLRDTFVAQMSVPSQYQNALDLLKDWDGMMEADKAAPLIMTAFFRQAIIEILKDDLGPVLKAAHTAPATTLLRILKQGGARDWCDRRGTVAIERCSEVLGDAFEKAMEELEQEYGKNVAQWKWGQAHMVSNEHNPFGKVGALKRFFNVERPASGGAYALLRGKTDFMDDRPYRAVHGAGYRAIYDFADLNKSLFIQSTGQSGNVMSDLYDDQVDLWAAGKYLPMTTKVEEYSNGALGTWMLTPKS